MADDTELRTLRANYECAVEMLADLGARCRLLEAERNTAREKALNEAAEALETEAKRSPRSWREHLSPSSFLDSREWIRWCARLVRGLPVPETQEQP